LFFEVGGYNADTFLEELGETVGDALLKTHQSFLPQIGPLVDSGKIKGLAHITGGGFLENIPRILPAGVSVEIDRGTWPELPVFGVMQKLGNVSDHEMFRTFNMGIGMIIVVSGSDRDTILSSIPASSEIGRVISGSKDVRIK
jgi:phosphoribosylformylglycinamidine cyclo-ligase